MWTTMKHQVGGRLRAIRSRWTPLPVEVNQLEVNRSQESPRWLDWITRAAQYGVPYEPGWRAVEQRLDDLMTDHPDRISSEHAELYMDGCETFEYIHVNHRGGRFLSTLVDQFDHPTIVEIGTAFGVSGMYMLSTIGAGKLWTFDPCHDWQDIATANLAAVSPNFARIAEPFEDGFPSRAEYLAPIDIAFVDGLHQYENVTREVQLLEPHMSDHSLLVLHDVELHDEMIRAWTEIRHSYRVIWSAFVERQFGICELGPR